MLSPLIREDCRVTYRLCSDLSRSRYRHNLFDCVSFNTRVCIFLSIVRRDPFRLLLYFGGMSVIHMHTSSLGVLCELVC